MKRERRKSINFSKRENEMKSPKNSCHTEMISQQELFPHLRFEGQGVANQEQQNVSQQSHDQ